MNEKNIYMPLEAEIKQVVPLSHDVNLYTVIPGKAVRPKPGQFFMVSVFGSGEAPISSASHPDEPLMLCIRKVGCVTTAIHSLKAGDKLGLRGPYGNGFPMSIARGKDVIIMAGGLGMAPLRPLIHEVIRNRKAYKDVFLLYGSKNSSEIIFRDEIAEWRKSLKVTLTVDCKDEKWKGCVGVVTGLLKRVKVDFKKTASFVCGPAVMIDASMKALKEKGMPDDRIITTLEAHMKCGVGKCGHCYMGPKYICTDGPVFSLKELSKLRLP